jgi:hypothetical protein
MNYKQSDPYNRLMLSMLTTCVILVLNVIFVLYGSGSMFWEKFHRMILSLVI